MSDMVELTIGREEEESLFARDIDGQLLRMEKAALDDFEKTVTIEINGRTITVPRAVPQTDAQGNIRRDVQGRPIPRATTIYDAATKLYVKQPGDKNPIPVLCHQVHLDPVGVCRLCSVEIWKEKRGSVQRERKLLPACQHRVEPTMKVYTPAPLGDSEAFLADEDQFFRDEDKSLVARDSELAAQTPPLGDDVAAAALAKEKAEVEEKRKRLVDERKRIKEARDRLRRSVSTLTELLATDNLTQEQRQTAASGGPIPLGNELLSLAAGFELQETRFPLRSAPRPKDDSSPFILVNHEACVLCDRCVRSCTDVKRNEVIGRTFKGYETQIGFDLNEPMNESSCVKCGECMVNCPTDALTFKNPVRPTDDDDEPGDPKFPLRREPVSADDAKRIPLFSGLPFKFLQWNTGSIKRRKVAAGETLCLQGAPGTTAFIIEDGEFEILVRPDAVVKKEEPKGLSRLFGMRRTRVKSDDGANEKRVAVATKKDLIVGEMTCMRHYPRSATVRALTEGRVLEINRNILFYLQRDPAARALLDQAYRENALAVHLRKDPLLKDCADYLRDVVDLIHVDPGQVIFRQGDQADHYYLVRLGFVKVSQSKHGQERVLDYLGPGKSFGEIGLLSEIQEIASEHFPVTLTRGVRSATCTALDDVELVRIRGEHFRTLVKQFPEAAKKVIESAVERLRNDEEDAKTRVERPLDDFLSQGLYGAQRLLVLDLESCTRCDECTRACSDTHDGITRLIREGLRFDKFLVASSCRSCLDPYCLVGCPVDAIHRRPRADAADTSLEIVIDDHCIGCGLCSSNCPYGNINMHPVEGGGARARRAVTCDLCREDVPFGGKTACVYACPHDAAFRMSGSDLMTLLHPTVARTN